MLCIQVNVHPPLFLLDQEKGKYSVFIKILFLLDRLFFFFFGLFVFSKAALVAYGGSHARGQIGAVAAGLRHSHSITGSEPCLQPAPQLMAMLDP